MISDWYDSYDGYSPNEWVDRDDHDDDLEEDYEDAAHDYDDY